MIYWKFITVLDAGSELSTVQHLRTTWCCWAHCWPAIISPRRAVWADIFSRLSLATAEKVDQQKQLPSHWSGTEKIILRMLNPSCGNLVIILLATFSSTVQALVRDPFCFDFTMIWLTLVLIPEKIRLKWLTQKPKYFTEERHLSQQWPQFDLDWCALACVFYIWICFFNIFKIFRMSMNLVCSRCFPPTTMWLPGIKYRLEYCQNKYYLTRYFVILCWNHKKIK